MAFTLKNTTAIQTTVTVIPCKDDAVEAPRPFIPSSEQQDIFDFVTRSTRNLAVNARAGTGKTTTLVQVAQRLGKVHGGSLALVFNKKNQIEMAAKFPNHWTVQTCHSLGFSGVRNRFRNPKVVGYKYTAAARDGLKMAKQAKQWRGKKIDKATHEALVREWPVSAVTTLINLAQSTLALEGKNTKKAKRKALLDLVSHYDVQFPWGPLGDLVLDMVLDHLQDGLASADRVISYGDMLWLPHVVDGCATKQYQIVAVDECQDLSMAQRRLAEMATKPGGRRFAVGDPKQAINGFAGADSESFKAIVDSWDCEVLPLTICRRCPAEILAEVEGVHIVPAEDAAKGTVAHVDEEDLVANARPGDLIICRNTAPLVSLCFQFIKMNRPAIVLGRAIGERLCSLAEEVSKVMDWKSAMGSGFAPEFTKSLESLTRDTIKAMKERGIDPDSDAVQAANDRQESLLAVLEGSRAESVQALMDAIQALFSDESNAITLSTIHKAKGAEAEVVWFYRPELCPNPYARKEWQIEQEENLIYVAITRAKECLFYVDSQGNTMDNASQADSVLEVAEKVSPKVVTATGKFGTVWVKRDRDGRLMVTLHNAERGRQAVQLDTDEPTGAELLQAILEADKAE